MAHTQHESGIYGCVTRNVFLSGEMQERKERNAQGLCHNQPFVKVVERMG